MPETNLVHLNKCDVVQVLSLFINCGRGKTADRSCGVPREVLKVRPELFWVSLFILMRLAELCLGYKPVMWNFDQSPYHHNESGSQNKGTLGVRGTIREEKNKQKKN